MASSSIDPITFDVQDLYLSEDRYAYYKTFRDGAGIVGKPMGADMIGRDTYQWEVLRHQDVAGMLKDPRFVHNIRRILGDDKMPPVSDKLKGIVETQSNWMLLRDPPDHTRLRSLVNSAFTPRIVQNLQPRVEEIAHFLLSEADDAEFDVIRDFAFPLPVIVIAELLGVPVEDREQFKVWSHVIMKSIDNATMEEMEQASGVAAELRDYFRTIVRAREQQPREDLITALVQTRNAGGQISEEELLDMCTLILVAGHETTVNLIGNAIWLMAAHEDQQALVRQNHAFIPSAIEEVLRFESPIQLTSRYVAEDMHWAGHALQAGQIVQLWLGSANRDSLQFAHPDTFDVMRQPNRHLAFSVGAHFCLGAPLARQEGQVALRAFLKHCDRFEVLGTPDWRPSILMRGVTALPVRCN